MIGEHRRLFSPLATAVAWPFVKLRVSPTAITLFSLVPGLATAYVVSQGEWAWGFGLGLVSGFLDVIDGQVARATGRVTKFGGYLDSVIDRVLDLAVLVAVGFALDSDRGWLLVGLCILGSYGTSYAKARSFESFPENRIRWGQFFERGERLVVLGLGFLSQAILDRLQVEVDVIPYALGVVAVGSVFTMVQRILAVHRWQP